MRGYLPFLVVGLTTGAVYALASTGLVLTYVTSGVFNFAHGAVGMFATYAFYSMRGYSGDTGLPTPLALLVAVVVVAPLMGVIIDRVFLRRLEGSVPATYVVASIGLLVGLQALATAIYGGNTRGVESFLPTGTYRLFDVNVGIDQTVIVAIAVGAGLALLTFFRGTHLGLQTRAVVSDRALTGLVGSNAAGVTTLSWMLGSAFAAASGILFAPTIGLDPLLLTLLVVEAFGAATVGRLRSFPVTIVAAFGLGVAQSLAVKLVSDLEKSTSLAGLPAALPFLTLFAVLVFVRKGFFTEATTIRHVPRRGFRLGRHKFPVKPLFASLAVAVVLPAFLTGSQRLTLATTITFVLLFSSLSLLVGLSRQVSLAHAVFVVFGATTSGHFLSAGVPYLLALPLAGLVLVPVGALLAIPAIRLSGLFLALATFGFGVLAQNLLFPTDLAFGSAVVVFLPRPAFLSGDLAFYYFLLPVVVSGVVAVEAIRVSRLGRILRALADSPNAMSSLGVSPLAARVLAFCLSAFLAALAGGLLGSLVGSVNPASFHFFQSLVWVAVLVFAGAQTFGGSVLAAGALVAVPAVFGSPAVTEWQPVVFGAAAMLLAQTHNGLIGLLRVPDFASLARHSRWRLDSQRTLERYLRVPGARRDAQPGPLVGQR
jgi:branched-subunit amino acid ABC-type transport system permease component